MRGRGWPVCFKFISDLCAIQDTRPPEEYNVSHLPGAVRVDPDSQHSLESLKNTFQQQR